MKLLNNIKNYIYGKGIMSQVFVNPECLKGTHKGKPFKIFIKKSFVLKGKKKPPQIVVEYSGKNLTAKHTRDIPNLLK